MDFYAMDHLSVSGQQFGLDLAMVENAIEELDLGFSHWQYCTETMATFINHAFDPFLRFLIRQESTANDWHKLILKFYGIEGYIIGSDRSPIFPVHGAVYNDAKAQFLGVQL